MWLRTVIGILCCIVGVVWIAQGTNMVHGSGMSGHGGWAWLGVVLLVIGVAILVRARRPRGA
jgi:uncharacterized membrane protein YidH (DUF202 family)